MSDFASCYFCGDAVDADVRGYPVVPEDADAPTVDLCPTCHRKLTNVLETVLTSVGDDAGTVGADGERAADDDPLPSVEGPDLDTGSDLLHDVETPVAGEGATGESDGHGATGDPDQRSAGSAPGDADREPAAGATGGAGSEPVAGAADGTDLGAGPDTEVEGEAGSADTSTEGVADATGDAASESATESQADEGTASETADADGHGTEQAAPDENSASDRGGAASAETASLLTTPTAKKVVKLLQNRAFPVDREEFTVVASNAYDIPMGDCEDVVDALVAEGYVRAEGEQLVRPEE